MDFHKMTNKFFIATYIYMFWLIDRNSVDIKI